MQFGMIFWFFEWSSEPAACDRQFHRQVGRGIGQILGGDSPDVRSGVNLEFVQFAAQWLIEPLGGADSV